MAEETETQTSEQTEEVVEEVQFSIKDVQNDFGRVQRATNNFVKQYDRSNTALYKALSEVYDFTNKATQHQAVFQHFVEENDEKYGKVAQDNPYFPVVKIAFRSTSVPKQSWTKYANVLRLANDDEVDAENFEKWITNYDGIEAAYKEARARFAKFKDPQQREKQIAEGKQNIRKRQPLAQTQVSDGFEHTGFADALVYVDENGNLQIYDLVETDESKLSKVFVQYASGGKLINHPLYPLYRALDFCKRATPKRVGKAEKFVEIRPRVNHYLVTVGFDHQFLSATSVIYIPDYDAEERREIDLQTVDNFLKAFKNNNPWEFNRASQNNDIKLEEDTDDESPEVRFKESKESRGLFSLENINFEIHATLDNEAIDGLWKEIQQNRKNEKHLWFTKEDGKLVLTGEHVKYQLTNEPVEMEVQPHKFERKQIDQAITALHQYNRKDFEATLKLKNHDKRNPPVLFQIEVPFATINFGSDMV